LKKLAQVSGGGVYFPKTLDQVEPVCAGIANEIRSRYTIGYIPATEGKQVRHVKVEAWTDERAKLSVRARNSYIFGPDSEAANRQ